MSLNRSVLLLNLSTTITEQGRQFPICHPHILCAGHRCDFSCWVRIYSGCSRSRLDKLPHTWSNKWNHHREIISKFPEVIYPPFKATNPQGVTSNHSKHKIVQVYCSIPCPYDPQTSSLIHGQPGPTDPSPGGFHSGSFCRMTFVFAVVSARRLWPVTSHCWFSSVKLCPNSPLPSTPNYHNIILNLCYNISFI